MVLSAPMRRKNSTKSLQLISSTFFEQLLCQYSCAKKLQSQTVTRENLCKTLLSKKDLSKMLMKLTPGDEDSSDGVVTDRSSGHECQEGAEEDVLGHGLHHPTRAHQVVEAGTEGCKL